VKVQPVALKGVWWWPERWMGSSAFLTMTLEEQGAFRNILDALWLRGGSLPDDDRILAKACGDASRWPTVRRKVMTYLVKVNGEYRNDTLDEVLRESTRRAAAQKAYRDRKNKGNGHA
jgi:uncharacterized protein YdaU (DUF1376 family)